jgi:hypothetical protein
MAPSPQPFQLSILEPALVDLKVRLAMTRFPDQASDGPWTYGTDLEYMRSLQLTARTRAAFGEPVNPHLFRSCAATTIAIFDPGRIGVARDLLGHVSLATTRAHYNKARSIEASRIYAKALAEACKSGEPLTRGFSLHGNWAAGAVRNRLLAADFKRLTRTEIRTSSFIANSISQSPDSERHSDESEQFASHFQIATPVGQRGRHICLTHHVSMLEQRADGRRSANCLACHGPGHRPWARRGR